MSDVYGSRSPQPGSGMNNGPDHLADQARAAADELKNKAAQTTGGVLNAAKEQAAVFSDTAKDVASAATGRVKAVMNDQKAVGADYLGNIAQAAQRAAGQFDNDVPQVANYIRQAAGQIDTVAEAIRGRDVGELVNEVQQFARRQPALFFGGAVVLGFAALRFLKSSRTQSYNGGMNGASSDSEMGA